MKKFGAYGILVESSAIAEIGYVSTEKLLGIRFKEGECWAYSGVEYDRWVEFSSAESIGKFFHKHIKKNYRQFRISETDILQYFPETFMPVVSKTEFSKPTGGIFIL